MARRDALQRILLVDPDADSGAILARRLRMQGYVVTECTTPADGARLALYDPPSAVVADLWMPSISGVQLCRLLNAEPGTAAVPVLLRGPESQRNRFWAERAGAAAYVVKGRMGDLVRSLKRVVEDAAPPDSFITQLASSDHDVRDRIAAHLDQALFESVIASEVRALGSAGAFDRLFDLFSQFACQLTNYRWLAVATSAPERLAVHCSPEAREACVAEARQVLSAAPDAVLIVVEDDDAVRAPSALAPRIYPVTLGGVPIARLAVSLPDMPTPQEDSLLAVVARELASPIRMANLLEESQRLASVDPLTGLNNRRAFRSELHLELDAAVLSRQPLCIAIFDIDHFKKVNDKRGHAAGDACLAAVGRVLRRFRTPRDIAARWGGEEFIVALPQCSLPDAQARLEGLRELIEGTLIPAGEGSSFGVTASFGVAQWNFTDQVDVLIDRADRAMYRAKMGGRNRVVADDPQRPPESGGIQA